MKITLTFEKQDDALVAMNGWKYKDILINFEEWLRSVIKHSDKDYLPIRVQLQEFIDKHNLDIHE